MSIIEFWKNHQADIDLKKLIDNSISVKGTHFHNPCRSLEIFGNESKTISDHDRKLVLDQMGITLRPSSLILDSGIEIPLGRQFYHPPFIWEDCSPDILAANFTYITNAFFRILKGLADQKLIPENQIEHLLDKACIQLRNIYKIRDGFIMRYINNNLNMYFISKIIENLVGKKIYNSVNQEPLITQSSLKLTLDTIDAFVSASVKQQMAYSIGRGIAFFEKLLNSVYPLSKAEQFYVEQKTYSYSDHRLAIDNRDHLIARVQDSNERCEEISMCVILDDTSETMFDLLWMQQLLEMNEFFSIHLLVNKAQISINFTSSMLQMILNNRHFKMLASKLNSQLFIHETFCPFMSFQTNLLHSSALKIAEISDFVFIKGMNFFETCQMRNKDTYHAFAVYGSVSREYTGLNDNDAVFAFIPAGTKGYIHSRYKSKIVSLYDVCSTANEFIA